MKEKLFTSEPKFLKFTPKGQKKERMRFKPEGGFRGKKSPKAPEIALAAEPVKQEQEREIIKLSVRTWLETIFQGRLPEKNTEQHSLMQQCFVLPERKYDETAEMDQDQLARAYANFLMDQGMGSRQARDFVLKVFKKEFPGIEVDLPYLDENEEVDRQPGAEGRVNGHQKPGMADALDGTGGTEKPSGIIEDQSELRPGQAEKIHFADADLKEMGIPLGKIRGIEASQPERTSVLPDQSGQGGNVESLGDDLTTSEPETEIEEQHPGARPDQSTQERNTSSRERKTWYPDENLEPWAVRKRKFSSSKGRGDGRPVRDPYHRHKRMAGAEE